MGVWCQAIGRQGMDVWCQAIGRQGMGVWCQAIGRPGMGVWCQARVLSALRRWARGAARQAALLGKNGEFAGLGVSGWVSSQGPQCCAPLSSSGCQTGGSVGQK
eukprot:305275-Chlamydomonas_euryale.AAC.2